MDIQYDESVMRQAGFSDWKPGKIVKCPECGVSRSQYHKEGCILSKGVKTVNRYEVLHQAISEISARCDGAVTQDGVGFNSQDTKFGHRTAAMPPDSWNDTLAAEVARILPTYQGQLRAYGVDYNALNDVIQTFKDAPDDRRVARDIARQDEYQRKHAPYVTIADGIVRVWNSFPIKDDLKANGFQFGRRGTKTWDSPLNGQAASTIIGLGVTLTDEQRAILDAQEIVPTEPGEAPAIKPNIDVSDGKLFIETEFNTVPLNIMRALPGRNWDGIRKVNWVSPHIGLIALAEEYKLIVSDNAREMIESHRAEQEAELATKRASMADSFATDTTMDVAIAEHLRPYQRAGAAYAINHIEPGKGVIIGDEMGLGKTRQLLSVFETLNAYPALILCPPKLTLTWQREIKMLLPHRTVNVYSGKANGHFMLDADFHVMGYTVVDSYMHMLPEIHGLGLDESHYVKNPKAGRTKAVLQISGHGVIEEKLYNGKKIRHPIPGKMAGDAVIIELTGTVVLNRPIELVEQLLAAGRLIREGNGEGSVNWFKNRFCDPQGPRGRVSFSGHSNERELHEWLRQNCYVRREKEDVEKELPPKTRAPMFIEMDNRAREIYTRLAEEGAEKAAESRASALVYMNALRHAVGTAKTETAVEWAHDFLDSTGKSLIIFAWHIDVQHGIIEGLKEKGYEVVHILGGQSTTATEEAKRAFQAKEARVIVISLSGSGKEGHTLTAASDVLLVEQGWNPGTQDQAEDRSHRIGQDQPVTAWYLIAQESVDEDLFSIVQGKRTVVRMINSGISVEDDEDTVFNQVLEMTLAKHGGGKPTFISNTPKIETQFRGCDKCGKVTDCNSTGDNAWFCNECDEQLAEA